MSIFVDTYSFINLLKELLTISKETHIPNKIYLFSPDDRQLSGNEVAFK